MTTFNILDAQGNTQSIPFSVPGTAGSPSADVASIQGITGMVPLVMNLPSGASTSALQTTGNNSLATIASNTGAVPSGAATSSLQTAGNNSLATIATNSGTVASGAATSAKQDTQTTALNSIVTNTGTVASGAATSALQTSGNSSLTAIANSVANIPATTAAGTASNNVLTIQGNTSGVAIPISGSVSITSAALPTGASTSALQTTGNTSLSSIDGKVTKANTDSVTIVSSTLPSGAATSANQSTANTSLASIANNTANILAPTAAGTASTNVLSIQGNSNGVPIPVVITSNTAGGATAANQQTEITALNSIVSNTNGVATAAKQDTGNGSLASIVTNTTGLATASGQSTMNSSLSTIATNSAKSGDLETAGADAESNTTNRQKTVAHLMGFNGTTWDRLKAGLSAATSTITGILNAIPMAKYVASPSTLTDGLYQFLRLDALGALVVNPGVQAGTISNTTVAVTAGTSTQLLTASTTLLAADFINNGTVTVYLNAGAAATVSNIPVIAGATYRFPIIPYNQVINAIAPSGGSAGSIIVVTGS